MTKRSTTAKACPHYVDVSLEMAARDLEIKIVKLEKNPNPTHLSEVTNCLRSFKLNITRALSRYGQDYKNGGQHFIDLATRSVEAAKLLPECITRTDGGDRSAHAALLRHREEIVDHVSKVCKPN